MSYEDGVCWCIPCVTACNSAGPSFGVSCVIGVANGTHPPRSLARLFSRCLDAGDYGTAANRLPVVLAEMRGAKNASAVGTLGDAIKVEVKREDPEIKETIRLGIDHLRVHDLRHLFATRSIESGVDLPTLASWLGHKDGGVLCAQICGHLCTKHSTAMAGKVKA